MCTSAGSITRRQPSVLFSLIISSYLNVWFFTSSIWSCSISSNVGPLSLFGLNCIDHFLSLDQAIPTLDISIPLSSHAWLKAGCSSDLINLFMCLEINLLVCSTVLVSGSIVRSSCISLAISVKLLKPSLKCFSAKVFISLFNSSVIIFYLIL